ncbi:putative cytochrome P450 monooxygenase [Linderina pennispora]|uniref:Putative cytochrome P450 monooxygenase n=1 Tax=Linderina pennispora TaxID=61395 RepID=A0A1Y1W550_9FUNG|nr:putative cytochrome P450 monooxygenase [Linderina pennispora]ORX68651.1 putative cytochrome P450 monooxygenase [Linderina pennispora]
MTADYLDNIFNIHPEKLSIWPVLLLAAAIYMAQLIYLAFFSPLSNIPGPLVNRFSNLPLKYRMVRGQYHSYSAALHAKYGEVVRIGHDHVSLSNTADCRFVLSTHAFPKGKMYDKGYSSKGFVVNTFTAVNPEVNKFRRRMIGDAFAIHTMRAVEGMVVDAGVGSLIKTWDTEISRQGGQACINYYDSFLRMGFDVIGRLCFDRNFNVLQKGNTEVVDWIHDTVTFAAFRGMVPWLSRQPWAFKKYKDSRASIKRLADTTVETRQKQIQEAGAPLRVDLLQKLVDAKDPETGNIFTPLEIQSEIILMLTAGSDTTSNMLTWTVMNLMHYPEIYGRVTREVRAAFADTSRTISFADATSRLPYLTAVIYESMRLTPSFSSILQRCAPTGGTYIQGFVIPSDSHICVSISACHRNPRLWKDPETFDPERFLGPDSAARMRDVLVFSSGVRICIGKNLAWFELYLVLANILRRYDLSLPVDAPYGPHRLDKVGAPVEIPAQSLLVTAPRNPKSDCRLIISLAETGF